MLSSQIPYYHDKNAGDFNLVDLLKRVLDVRRASWKDIYKDSGIYMVYHKNPTKIKFNGHGGQSNCDAIKKEKLQAKWHKISRTNETDIIYIGKGNVRHRVRSLIRFGLGKAKNHSGGEWLWQIDDYEEMRLIISYCPRGKEAAYERYLLELFKTEHGDWPLANRMGGTGVEIWFPPY